MQNAFNRFTIPTILVGAVLFGTGMAAGIFLLDEFSGQGDGPVARAGEERAAPAQEPAPEVTRQAAPEVTRQAAPEVTRESAPEVTREPAPEVTRQAAPAALAPAASVQTASSQSEQAAPVAWPRASYYEILERVSERLVAAYYAANPNILVLDFPTLRDQAHSMNRVAALIEYSDTPRDRVLTEAELMTHVAGRGDRYETFYFGHNYRASEVARFYNAAAEQGVALNPVEESLRRVLLDSGFLRAEGGRYAAVPPEKALVSVVQVERAGAPSNGVVPVDRALRETTLRHELSHGEFVTNAAYRDYCIRFWRDTMSERERTAFRDFLAGSDYDPNNAEVIINEMQAFLAHTPDPRAFNAAMLGMSESELDGLRRRFWSGLKGRGSLNDLVQRASGG